MSSEIAVKVQAHHFRFLRDWEKPPHFVYELWGEVEGQRRCLYVGMTGNPERRLREHSRKHYGPLVSEVKIHRFANRRIAEHAEGVRIRDLKPLLNSRRPYADSA